MSAHFIGEGGLFSDGRHYEAPRVRKCCACDARVSCAARRAASFALGGSVPSIGAARQNLIGWEAPRLIGSACSGGGLRSAKELVYLSRP